MLKKIVSIKITSAVFLATVLVAGIISLSSPSFMTASAQSQPYNGYNSYEPEYPPSYGKDNSYYYQSEYPPYAADEYKNKNDYYKSKDPSVINQKFKCINNNINIVGADINQLPSNSLANGLAAQGLQDEDDGLDSNSLSQEGNNDDGINLDKNIINVCKSINNNVLNAAQEPDEPLTCVECLEKFLTEPQLHDFLDFFGGRDETPEEFCTVIVVTATQFSVRSTLSASGVPPETINKVVECLLEAGIVFAPGP